MKEKKKISNKMLTLILILNYVLFFFVLFIGGFIDVAKEMGDKFIYYSVFMFFLLIVYGLVFSVIVSGASIISVILSFINMKKDNIIIKFIILALNIVTIWSTIKMKKDLPSIYIIYLFTTFITCICCLLNIFNKNENKTDIVENPKTENLNEKIKQ